MLLEKLFHSTASAKLMTTVFLLVEMEDMNSFLFLQNGVPCLTAHQIVVLSAILEILAEK